MPLSDRISRRSLIRRGAVLAAGGAAVPYLVPSNVLAAPGRPISVSKVSAPIKPFMTEGDLWFSTWADDDTLFSAWGDGHGPYDDLNNKNNKFSHHGLARITGIFPDVQIETVNRNMPLVGGNSKPTSLLFLDSRLYAAVHQPLCLPKQGIIAYSDDRGATFQFDTRTDRTVSGNRRFICLMFISHIVIRQVDKSGMCIMRITLKL